MAQPLKELINTESVGRLAGGLAAAWAPFAREEFVRAALAGLDGLELKERVRHVAGALAAALPVPFPQAAGLLREAVAQAPLDLWSGWPATDYVALHGLDHLDEAMGTLAVLTRHSTGEFAVRPFLDRYEERALAVMHRWAGSPDEHIRRLASEGSRPRLPWGARVPWLMRPGPTLPILDLLRDDPSEYVRRSVANHVNDLAKDHPEVALRLLDRWRSEGGSHVEKVLRHAVRGLLRSGHSGALTLVGAQPGQGSVEKLILDHDQVTIGGHLRFNVTVAAAAPGALVLRYAVRRDGSRRVFHLGERTADAGGQTFTLAKSHSFKPVTTRTEPPGPRVLEIVVNGTVRASAPFDLLDTP
ncbi:DNA alkylation repair protein [Nonomuraea jiangxiensis]|uniref:3-methyladenine DNA glycosylase AlkC n=1 Tax=Nonomuraea jiangxiensis TaxID=633440 RepID=A0A1G8QLY8_9ACTN|nr:DNA alkylation repair protein [Nonomuraea jiangxiensis]SDJ05799.1 3-methyladenine DNA glycosylase AlkC [Nonomuraea jiangxiensis]